MYVQRWTSLSAHRMDLQKFPSHERGYSSCLESRVENKTATDNPQTQVVAYEILKTIRLNESHYLPMMASTCRRVSVAILI
jgi:hypothetical protein